MIGTTNFDGGHVETRNRSIRNQANVLRLRIVPQFRASSITHQPEELVGVKPSIEEVLKYAKPQVLKFISQYAKDEPSELKEEIEQEAYLRLIEFYPGIKADAGWKSYVYNHCRGSVLDYLKFGRGFQEKKWSLAKTEPNDSKFIWKIRDRLSLSDSDNEDLDLEYVLGANGVFSELESSQDKIRWDLVARMASIDQCIHALAKHILDIPMKEMRPTFDLGRSRIGQLIHAALRRFDDPDQADETWFKQMCYAFGLCEAFGMPDVDQSDVVGYPVGWNLKPVDLFSNRQMKKRQWEQLSLFDLE